MRFFILALVCMSVTNLCHAENAQLQAISFARIFTSYCIRHIDDLDVLERQLNIAPQLAPQGAAVFLKGAAGGAWPVTDLEGLFVIALPADKNQCIIYARRAAAAKTVELFIDKVSNPPAPLLVRKTGDQLVETTNNGTTHVIEYEWYTEDASRKIVLTLSTSSFENAQLQVMGSVTVVTE